MASTRRLPACLDQYPENDIDSTDVVGTGGTLIAEGCHSLFRSENDGATWEQHRLPFACTPSLIAADRPSNIWAMCTFMVGAGQQLKWIYRSLNGGTTWKLVRSTTLGRKGTSIGEVSTTGYAFMLVATSPQHAVLFTQFSGAFAQPLTGDGSGLPSKARGVCRVDLALAAWPVSAQRTAGPLLGMSSFERSMGVVAGRR